MLQYISNGKKIKSVHKISHRQKKTEYNNSIAVIIKALCFTPTPVFIN